MLQSKTVNVFIKIWTSDLQSTKPAHYQLSYAKWYNMGEKASTTTD
jgi:hypothetical protein